MISFGYLVPFAVAVTRGKSNQGAVLVINLLAGWTLVGWIVALVALQPHRTVGYATVPSEPDAKTLADSPGGFNITYSTADWNMSEWSAVEGALKARGVGFVVQNGLLMVQRVVLEHSPSRPPRHAVAGPHQLGTTRWCYRHA